MVQIAVDVGGTFTDVVCFAGETALHTTKVPTTPRRVVDGIINGALKVLKIAGRDVGEVTRFIHSTTIATNAILEHKGAKTALLMTEGFEDILEIGRQKRTEIYNLNLEPQTPVFLVPRYLRAGIAERVDADGAVRKPLDEENVVSVVRELVRRFRIESVAISFLFSFANPAHERRARELVRENFPALSVSISAEVDPVFREYERTCLTSFDAYVRPIVVNYIEELSGALRGAGINAELRVMQSRGGITGAGVVSERPVAMLLSGPAGGVVGARYVGAQSGHHNLVTVDIGGTSCDVALIREGRPLISREGRIATYPLRMSMVDVNTVGAGGGSMVSRDVSGGLRVGPESAGSDPGPICYRRGGTAPTVTDASLVLGYLNPDYFAAGDFSLDLQASRAGVERVARQFGLDVAAMAAGIHRIVNERMANEIRLVSVKRGHDPRHFALTPLGGAGPVHGGRLAELLSIPKMLVPSAPGVLSAFGLLVSNIEHEQTQTLGARTKDVEPGRIESLFAELDALCASKMAREGTATTAREAIQHFLDIRYGGQSYELEIPVGPVVDGDAVRAAETEFHRLHRVVFGYDRPSSPTEIINLRTVHTIEIAGKPPVAPLGDGPRGFAVALKQTRAAYFSEIGKFRDTPVYERGRLPIGEPFTGPAIVEQADTTTVVYPGHVASIDAFGNLIVSTRKAG